MHAYEDAEEARAIARRRVQAARDRARAFLIHVKGEAGQIAPSLPSGRLAEVIDELARLTIPDAD